MYRLILVISLKRAHVIALVTSGVEINSLIQEHNGLTNGKLSFTTCFREVSPQVFPLLLSLMSTQEFAVMQPCIEY